MKQQVLSCNQPPPPSVPSLLISTDQGPATTSISISRSTNRALSLLLTLSMYIVFLLHINYPQVRFLLHWPDPLPSRSRSLNPLMHQDPFLSPLHFSTSKHKPPHHHCIMYTVPKTPKPLNPPHNIQPDHNSAKSNRRRALNP